MTGSSEERNRTGAASGAYGRRAHGRSVLFLVNSLTVGGSERKTVRLANALVAEKLPVALAYLNPPETLLPQLHPAVAAMNLERHGKFSLRALRRVAAIVRERSVDALVAVNLYPALYAVMARRLCREERLRVVVSVNTTDLGTRKERLQMLLYRHVLQRADLIVFGAERQRTLWGSRYGLQRPTDRSAVLYNGIDTALYCRANVAPARPEPAGRVILGTVGAFRSEKAQVHLVRAVNELLGRGFDVGAIIVGDGAQRPEIEREIRTTGLDQRVRLVGEVQDVRPCLASMDIFVLPSVAVETFSNAVLEAMAMSCPIVSARIGGMEEMLQFGGGMTYPPGDIKALCDLLAPLVTDAERRRQMGAQARKAAEEHFSLSRMLRDFTERVLDASGSVATP
ncbi:MAG: glycosyltransferase family 4 protein [Gammaproteobacteria bacterium]|nr:glycosyltransferase family 4 protein [Gammaproteobacteria bacterium]